MNKDIDALVARANVDPDDVLVRVDESQHSWHLASLPDAQEEAAQDADIVLRIATLADVREDERGDDAQAQWSGQWYIFDPEEDRLVRLLDARYAPTIAEARAWRAAKCAYEHHRLTHASEIALAEQAAGEAAARAIERALGPAATFDFDFATFQAHITSW